MGVGWPVVVADEWDVDVDTRRFCLLLLAKKIPPLFPSFLKHGVIVFRRLRERSGGGILLYSI